ncbi:RNA 2',3'-cyclic phosphodiesterase [Patescibacteria group bacterium]|nr:RNA 2',3'-cyclic phosphodiesterase [Patescibacteria group bacterium]MBU1703611.1 RNA 2',3'-cyclic phosphodiesterase [Patescibacteria group bacterium]MBU1953558.1 RNA 2',3'-cyclic phosphodiesterase [Patescibacteria group bacterium]
MKKRLFVSIPLPPEMMSVLSDYERNNLLPDVQWVNEENLHVTVFFCGDVEEADISRLDARIGDALKGVRAFDLGWKEILFAPPGKVKRMVWGEYHSNAGFDALAGTVYDAVKPFVDASIKKSRGRMIPHITMARFKNPAVADKVRLPQTDPGMLNVRNVELMSSELKPEGSLYTVLSSYALI